MFFFSSFILLRLSTTYTFTLHLIKNAFTNVTHLDLIGNDRSVIKLHWCSPRKQNVSVSHCFNLGTVGTSRDVTQNNSDSGSHLPKRIASYNFVQSSVWRCCRVQSKDAVTIFSIDNAQPVRKISKVLFYESFKVCLFTINQNFASILCNKIRQNIHLCNRYVCMYKIDEYYVTQKTIPRVFHKDQIVLQPMDGSLRLRCNQTRQLQGFSLSESHVLWLFTEEWYHTIDDLCGDSLLQKEIKCLGGMSLGNIFAKKSDV